MVDAYIEWGYSPELKPLVDILIDCRDKIEELENGNN